MRAFDIAAYIVQKYNRARKYISAPDVQAIMYMSWQRYYQRTMEMLFVDNFFAYEYGPAVPIVETCYEVIGETAQITIAKRFVTNVTGLAAEIIDSVIIEVWDVGEGILMKSLTDDDSPWRHVTKMFGLCSPIAFAYIAVDATQKIDEQNVEQSREAS